jgi:hypothetical protein
MFSCYKTHIYSGTICAFINRTAQHTATTAPNKILYQKELHGSRTFHMTVKVNFTLEQAMKAQRGSRGIALLFP